MNFIGLGVGNYVETQPLASHTRMAFNLEALLLTHMRRKGLRLYSRLNASFAIPSSDKP